MDTNKIFIYLEDLNDGSFNLSFNGNGERLINILSDAIAQSSDFKLIVEMALAQSLPYDQQEDQSEDNKLIEMLGNMKMGLA